MSIIIGIFSQTFANFADMIRVLYAAKQSKKSLIRQAIRIYLEISSEFAGIGPEDIAMEDNQIVLNEMDYISIRIENNGRVIFSLHYSAENNQKYVFPIFMLDSYILVRYSSISSITIGNTQLQIKDHISQCIRTGKTPKIPAICRAFADVIIAANHRDSL